MCFVPEYAAYTRLQKSGIILINVLILTVIVLEKTCAKMEKY